MLADVWNLLCSRWDFFSGLLLEHIEISAISIAIAIVVGSAPAFSSANTSALPSRRLRS